MRHRITRALAALAAALVMALAAGTAAATTFSYSEANFRIVWINLTFSESGGGLPITCPITLEGSFNSRTIEAVEGILAARITAATVGTCTEGRGSVLTESLPWSVFYEGYTGTLPNITSVQHYLVGAAFQVEPSLGVVCLARTSEEWPASGTATREAGGNITGLSADPELPIPVTGSAQCPRFGIFSGGGEVFVQGSMERRVRLTLI